MVSHPDLQHSQEAKWGRSLVNMAIISPLLGFVTTNHLALLILSLLTYLAHFPIYWSQARDFKGLAFLAHSVRMYQTLLGCLYQNMEEKVSFQALRWTWSSVWSWNLPHTMLYTSLASNWQVVAEEHNNIIKQPSGNKMLTSTKHVT